MNLINSLSLPITQLGNVRGAASSTNLAITRYNGTSGLLLQDSTVLLDNSGNLSGVGTIDSLALPPVQFGNVLGAASSTNLALVRFNSTSGKLIQDSIVTLDNPGNLLNINNINGFPVGNILGPGSATDSAVALYSTTTGKLLKNSTVTIDGSGNLLGVGTINGNAIFSSSYAFMNSTLTPGVNVTVTAGNRWIFANCPIISGFTFGSGQLTAPATGVYSVTWGYNQANQAQHIWALCVNGVEAADGAYWLANNFNGADANTKMMAAHGTVVIQLISGDTIGVINPTVSSFTIAGAAQTTIVQTLTFYLTIHRIA